MTAKQTSNNRHLKYWHW